MWIVTRSDWPVLINLNRSAHIGYHQPVKFNPQTRIVASMWEQEFELAQCADGDEARRVIDHIARALASGVEVLDLRDVDAQFPA
jgi:hypothetical protein